MGQFSWITQDTKEAIRERYGCLNKRLTTAYMHDNHGLIWKEESYEGYGVFGGKDYYQLLAEMNKADGLTGNTENDRRIGIKIAFGGDPFISPNLTRENAWTWVNCKPEDDPNQGWGEGEEDYDEEYDNYLI